MVIPVGHDSQTLEFVTNNNGIEWLSHGPVRFVPLTATTGSCPFRRRSAVIEVTPVCSSIDSQESEAKTGAHSLRLRR